MHGTFYELSTNVNINKIELGKHFECNNTRYGRAQLISSHRIACCKLLNRSPRYWADNLQRVWWFDKCFDRISRLGNWSLNREIMGFRKFLCGQIFQSTGSTQEFCYCVWQSFSETNASIIIDGQLNIIRLNFFDRTRDSDLTDKKRLTFFLWNDSRWQSCVLVGRMLVGEKRKKVDWRERQPALRRRQSPSSSSAANP